jgi:hypothetical protein
MAGRYRAPNIHVWGEVTSLPRGSGGKVGATVYAYSMQLNIHGSSRLVAPYRTLDHKYGPVKGNFWEGVGTREWTYYACVELPGIAA